MSTARLYAIQQTMLLTRNELLESHRLLDTVEVPREAEEGGEKLSISQRVEALVEAHKACLRRLIAQ